MRKTTDGRLYKLHRHAISHSTHDARYARRSDQSSMPLEQLAAILAQRKAAIDELHQQVLLRLIERVDHIGNVRILDAVQHTPHSSSGALLDFNVRRVQRRRIGQGGAQSARKVSSA